MAIAASNSWIASFDNVSTLQDWQSDALARLATGAGFGTRQLYSDDEETLVHVARPLILNGIGGIVTRPDLMDRAIVIDLPAIPDDRRRPEAAFYAEFEAARPRLLGALLAAVSSAFARENEIDIHGLPRMADATKWVTAAEPVLRWPNLAFLTAYRANRADSRALTLDASPLTAPIDLLVADHWSGTATELLHELELRAAQDVVARRDWPRTARILGVELRRLAPDLRRVKQIEVAFERLAGTRTIRLVREGNLASSPSSPSTELVPSDANDDRSHDRTNGAGQHQPILAMPFDRQPEPPSGDLVGDS
ncbi:MAG: hypothetical protein OEV36_12625, partial [Myxococcales bacterium]|nr:hypothetical protein [Myxococcales bacterium]